jgi:uncharacterized protein
MKPLLLAVMAIMSLTCAPASAQVLSDRPVIYSQTMISIVPGSTVPSPQTQSPDLQAAEDTVQQNAPADAEPAAESATADVQNMLAQQPAAPTMTLRVQVRAEQIPIDRGLLVNYPLDSEHGVLTYFADDLPRDVVAENIQKPLDMLFIRDDGIIAQIIPQVVPAYLTETISPKFRLRALLYLQAGLAEQWGIRPGFRIEHGMFRPKPLIYMAPDEE